MQVKCWPPHKRIVPCILAVDYGPEIRCRLDRRQSLFAILRLLALTLIVDEPNVRLLAPTLPRSAQIVTGAGARSSTSRQSSPGRCARGRRLNRSADRMFRPTARADGGLPFPPKPEPNSAMRRSAHGSLRSSTGHCFSSIAAEALGLAMDGSPRQWHGIPTINGAGCCVGARK